MTETYYDVLGVAPGATTAEIEQAYRERLKETHPDVSDEDDARDRTRLLIEARDVLTDPAERARYDRVGHTRYVGEQERAGGTRERQSSGTGSETRDSESGTRGQGDTEHRSWGDRSTEYGSWGAEDDPGDERQDRAGQTAGTGPQWSTGRDRSGRAPRDSWRDGREQSGRRGTDRSWRAWDSDTPYSTRDEGLHRSRLFASSQSLVLLSATFFLYPVLLGAALFPAFPLVVNVAMGACLVGVVAFLQSMPEIGIAVFGIWSVVIPAALVALGVDLVSLVAGAAVVATVLPLGLSLLTRSVVR